MLVPFYTANMSFDHVLSGWHINKQLTEHDILVWNLLPLVTLQKTLLRRGISISMFTSVVWLPPSPHPQGSTKSRHFLGGFIKSGYRHLNMISFLNFYMCSMALFALFQCFFSNLYLAISGCHLLKYWWNLSTPVREWHNLGTPLKACTYPQ